MQTALIIISFLVIAQPSEFDALLNIRDFNNALELTGESDSLSAEVFRRSGNPSMASMLFERAFAEDPSAGLFAAIWAVISGSTEHFPSMSSGYLREELPEWSSMLDWEPQHLLSLIESAAVLEDSILADSLMRVLVDSFPESMEASEVISWEFYDNLYPVWNDDSARILVLQDFLDEWGDKSDLWRSRAWQYTLNAVFETADSTRWTNSLEMWLEACPDDPQACLSGAAMYIDRDSSWSEALELAEKGLVLMDSSWIPVGIPQEEWLLTGMALETGLNFRKCFAMAGLGHEQKALQDLEDLLSLTVYPVDDFHTEASLHWLAGRLNLRIGDTLQAMNHFLDAAVLGEVRNRWSGEAVLELDSLLPTGVIPEEWGRDKTGYNGPIFEDVTYLLGPDSLVSGSRVSWCDWNSDGYPDILIGHSLYQNIEGNSFIDVTSEAGLDSCRGNGGIWGDINRDGFPDLVTSGNPVQIFVNIDGVLKDRTERMGVIATNSKIEGVALLDWNADGWLDLYLASYEQAGNMGSGTPDAFYLGGPDGFIQIGDSLGMNPFLDKPLCGRGVSPCDFNRDGNIDIFVSNYRLQENFLWENTSEGAINSALTKGLAGTDTDGWWGHTIGSAWGDYDRDGDWDLFSANLAHPRYIVFSDMSELLVNEDDLFTDGRGKAGIRFEETHSNPVWGDFNNDGWLDLFITSIYSDRRSFLYLNQGDRTFRDVTWLAGARVFNGWGAAAADFDLDGKLDLMIGSGDGPILLRNVTESGYGAIVKVYPPDGVNPSGIGCTVELEQDGIIYLRQVEGGSGTTSQNSRYLHFGLSSGNPFSMKLFVPGNPVSVTESEGLPGSISTIGR
ncbi:MAG: VCBS repeat-containing protein [Candidatus Aegiribacteria sp.]|nr:VCBS repeat-containing protein [Candidatus Aegiribacteria sp.]